MHVFSDPSCHRYCWIRNWVKRGRASAMHKLKLDTTSKHFYTSVEEFRLGKKSDTHRIEFCPRFLQILSKFSEFLNPAFYTVNCPYPCPWLQKRNNSHAQQDESTMACARDLNMVEILWTVKAIWNLYICKALQACHQIIDSHWIKLHNDLNHWYALGFLTSTPFKKQQFFIDRSSHHPSTCLLLGPSWTTTSFPILPPLEICT
jgi:hypothetical protein